MFGDVLECTQTLQTDNKDFMGGAESLSQPFFGNVAGETRYF